MFHAIQYVGIEYNITEVVSNVHVLFHIHIGLR